MDGNNSNSNSFSSGGSGSVSSAVNGGSGGGSSGSGGLTSDIVFSGYLVKSPPIKRPDDNTICKWHSRFFVIRQNSSEIEYWEDERLANCKGKVDMKTCKKIRPNVESKKYPFLFSLVLPDREWFFAAEKAEDKAKWLQHLSELTNEAIGRSDTGVSQATSYRSANTSLDSHSIASGYSSVESRSISTSSLGYKTIFRAIDANKEPKWLRVVYPNLEMLDFATRSVLQYWPLANLRSYGQDDVKFTFEAGRKCPSGPGTFVFELQPGDDIYSTLDHVVSVNVAQPTAVDIAEEDEEGGGGVTCSESEGVYSNPEESRMSHTEQHGSSPYTIVQTKSYVQITPGMFTPPTNVITDSSSSYVQIDIAKTEALKKTLQDKEKQATAPSPAGRKTRHDLPSDGQTQRPPMSTSSSSSSLSSTTTTSSATTPSKSEQRRGGSLASVKMTATPEEEVDDLLASVELEIGIAKPKVYENVILRMPSNLKYVNLPTPPEN